VRICSLCSWPKEGDAQNATLAATVSRDLAVALAMSRKGYHEVGCVRRSSAILYAAQVLSFYDLSRHDLLRFVDLPARAGRVFKAVYQEHAGSFSEVRQIPPTIRALLDGCVEIKHLTIRDRYEAADGTLRYLLGTPRGDTMESVLIPAGERLTFCISSQIGCALGCTFCLTGQLGLIRDLSAGEIVAQVVLLAAEAAVSHPGKRYSIVLMGMGEPLQNYDNVTKAIGILHDDCGLSIPASRITLSTAGLVPGIERLAQEPVFPNLCISLTGVTDSSRDLLMPINRKYPIEAVIDAVRSLPRSRADRVMFECVMIKGLTDSEDDARTLVHLLQGTRAKVNLIPLNSAPEIPYDRPSDEVVLRFQSILRENGVTAFIRKNRGNDVSGACGQLKRKELQSSLASH
jgi:23S rRNA (adenine2503-C2)-methyltransferase